MTLENWKTVFLPEVTFFQEGPGVRKSQFRKEGVKLLNVRNLVNNKLETSNTETCISEEEATTKYKHFLIDEDDLIIASSGISPDTFYKKVAFAEKENLPLCMNTSTIRFKSVSSDLLDIKFFRYFLMTDVFANQVRKFITGSAQLNFGPSHLKKMKMPLPPIETQREITKILEKAEGIRKSREQANQMANKFLQAEFLHIFSLERANRENWQFEFLQELALPVKGAIQSGPFGSDLHNSDFVNEGILAIGVDNVYANKFVIGRGRHITQKKYQELVKFTARPKDVLVTVMGTVGRSCVFPISVGPAIITKHIYRISLDQEKCIPEFLSSALNWDTEIRKQLGASITGAIVDGLTSKTIKSIKVRIPPIQLQIHFVELLSKYNVLQRNQLVSSHEIGHLFDSLMSKAFNGELVS